MRFTKSQKNSCFKNVNVCKLPEKKKMGSKVDAILYFSSPTEKLSRNQ